MKRVFLAGMMAMVLMFGAGRADAASDMIILDDGQDTVVTGTVEGVRYNYIIVLADGKEFKVDFKELGIANKADEYFPAGSRVQVTGQLFDGDELKARQMIKLEDAALPAAQ